MSSRSVDPSELGLSRRDMLTRSGMGFGLLGLWSVMEQSGLAADTNLSPLAPRKPHFPAKAKRVVHLFMNGGPSQVDTFDPKPMLEKYHGKALPTPNLRTERKTGAAMKSPWPSRKYGKSGIEATTLFEKTCSNHIDDLCIIRSMQADVPNHEPSLMLMNCGESRQPRPSMGSWVTYGLGTENQNLPGFVVLCPNGYPIYATQNWRSSFLPGAYQGTYIDTAQTDIRKLIENIKNDVISKDDQRKQLDFLKTLNEHHRRTRPADPQLDARIQSFELAYRMQSDAADAFDFNKEPAKIKEMYGTGIPSRQLMITRRLLERGVRFVQVWAGEGQPWDNHDNLAKEHERLGKSWDQAISAFLTDLKQRGMFDDTLVIWGGEFGRTPVAEFPQLSGRDHNHYGFSMWLAGGGAKRGHVHGATDEFGFAAVQDKVHVHDLHATILALLGFDHEKLTYRFAGRDFRLTDIHGRVVRELMG